MLNVNPAKICEVLKREQEELDAKTAKETNRIRDFSRFLAESFDTEILNTLNSIDEDTFTVELLKYRPYYRAIGAPPYFVVVLYFTERLVYSSLFGNDVELIPPSAFGKDLYERAESLNLLGVEDLRQKSFDVIDVFKNNLFDNTEITDSYPKDNERELVKFDLLPKTRDFALEFERKFPYLKLIVEYRPKENVSIPEQLYLRADIIDPKALLAN
jgi:hypothetical protein